MNESDKDILENRRHYVFGPKAVQSNHRGRTGIFSAMGHYKCGRKYRQATTLLQSIG